MKCPEASGQRSRHGKLWSNQTVLRVLRNPVYLGKIAHGDDLHDGKHQSILDESLYTRAQLLLDERAAESTTTRPTTSEYLLSGKLRCQTCGGAYVGAGAHGRNTFYRYYVCRTRQAKGARACTAQRVPADDLEDAIAAALIATYDAHDLFESAANDAYAEAANERPRLQAELASAETQLRETSTAIDRYLHAFEAGTMSDTLCAPRIAELSQRRDELTARRNQLAVQARAAAPQLPTATQLRTVSAQVRLAISEASPDVIKQLYDELIDRIDISPDKHAQPYFWVPDVQQPGPSLARACGTPASPVSETPVRMGPHHVEVLRRYSNFSDLVKRVQEVLRRIEENDQGDEPGVCSTGRGGGLAPVRERLGEAGLAELVTSFRGGTPKHELAARYGISLSSVKRVLWQRRMA